MLLFLFLFFKSTAAPISQTQLNCCGDVNTYNRYSTTVQWRCSCLNYVLLCLSKSLSSQTAWQQPLWSIQVFFHQRAGFMDADVPPCRFLLSRLSKLRCGLRDAFILVGKSAHPQRFWQSLVALTEAEDRCFLSLPLFHSFCICMYVINACMRVSVE